MSPRKKIPRLRTTAAEAVLRFRVAPGSTVTQHPSMGAEA
jgi:hypothetical protein